MGNYKSRPPTSCSDELKKKISEGYAVVRSRLNDDVKARVSTWSEVQISAFEKSLTEFISLLNIDNADILSSQNLSLLHIICSGHNDSQAKVSALLSLYDNDDAKKRSIVSMLTNNGFSSLHLAIYKMDPVLVQFLLQHGADPTQDGRHHLPPLHLAAMGGSPLIVKHLLDAGAPLHANDFVKFTALHCATYFAHEPIVKCLLEHGADANWAGGVRDRPLHLAASRGLVSIAELLLLSGADAFLEDDEGNLPLHFAAKAGHIQIVNLLLKKYFNNVDMIINRNVYGDTPLHSACYSGRADVARALLSAADYNVATLENVYSETPLHAACTSGKSAELVNLLMKQPGVDPNYQGQDGHTALHSACYHGHLRIVQFLLENGADQSLTAKAIDTPLAATHGYVCAKPSTVASAILQLNRPEPASSSISSHNSTISLEDQQTPILWAYEKGHDEIVALLKHYANRRADGDLASEYSSGESSYTPLPSPMGRLHSITREKAEILQLRSTLKPIHHLNLGDVDFQEAIGSGSFGKVYRGTYRGRTVAIKRYRAIAFGSKSEVDLLCREVSILSRLSHPNILSFIGASLDDPSQFAIITEFAENGSLFCLLHEQKRVLEPAFRLRISYDVSQGMRYLHDSAVEPVIHRDLNSHNILIQGNGRSVVADFGESRFAAQNDHENMTKQPGNLRWMAPEVFSQSGRYDQRLDVFSFALVVWEIHSAELPFAHLKPAAAAAEMAYKQGRPSLPHGPTAQFPAHILKLLVQAWHADPALRPPFSEIVNILEPHVDNHFNIEVSSSVSQLKTQWEQISAAPTIRAIPTLNTLYGITSSGTVEELRQRLDNNGYVTQPQSSVRSKLAGS